MKIFFLAVLTSSMLLSCTQQDNNDNNQSSNDKASLLYEIIGTKHNNVVQNFYLFVKDTSYLKLTEIYKAFKKEHCSIQCNINLYTTPKGFELEENYRTEKNRLSRRMTNQEINKKEYLKLLDQYDSKAYCELANNLIASGIFSSDEIYMHPYKDWRYRELKCK